MFLFLGSRAAGSNSYHITEDQFRFSENKKLRNWDIDEQRKDDVKTISGSHTHQGRSDKI